MSRDLEPVMLVRELGGLAAPGRSEMLIHEFVGHKAPRARCELCGAAQENGLSKAFQRGDSDAVPPMVHHAFPSSINEGGSGHNHAAWQSHKQAWEAVFARLLLVGNVPTGLSRVLVEGEWTFARRFSQGPDQENYRYPCSKFLGDAMQLGGWLPNDGWSQFEFGGATYRLERGVKRLRLMVFPVLADTLELAA